MLFKLTIPPQKVELINIDIEIEAIFKVIGYYKCETNQTWILSNNTLFIHTYYPFINVTLTKYPQKKDFTFILNIFWKRTQFDEYGVESIIEERTRLIVSTVKLINDYPLP